MVKNVYIEEILKQLEYDLLERGGFASLREANEIMFEEMSKLWKLVKQDPSKLSLEEKLNRFVEIRKELLQITAISLKLYVETNENRQMDGVF